MFFSFCLVLLLHTECCKPSAVNDNTYSRLLSHLVCGLDFNYEAIRYYTVCERKRERDWFPFQRIFLMGWLLKDFFFLTRMETLFLIIFLGVSGFTVMALPQGKQWQTVIVYLPDAYHTVKLNHCFIKLCDWYSK